MSFLLRRLKPHHLLPPPSPSPPFYHLPSTFSFPRLLSTATASPQAPPPSPQSSFSAEYLIHSCGLPSDEALRAYNKIQHLKSPVKPDAVLQFLRRTGIREPDIRTAVSRAPHLLCSHVEKNLRPNVAKLQEIGLSVEDISGIISHNPDNFLFNFASKIDFWMRVLGSGENLLLVLKRSGKLLNMSLEKVAVPNLSFLRGRCGLSADQIVRLIKSNARLIASNPETLKMRAQRAEDLGFARSSPMFVHALIATVPLSQHTLDARLNDLKSLGLSQEELNLMIRRAPLCLGITQELVGRKIEYLIKEAACDKVDVVRNPVLLTLSLEKRLVPRNIVRKLLMSKGLLVANKKLTSFFKLTEKQFMEKFVLPYEHAIPGIH